MPLLKYFTIPIGIFVVAVIYWFASYEWAGSVLLLIFAIAMAILGWILVPTLNAVGPTAPVDSDWHERNA
jgi:hypothetical protein